MQKPKKGDWSSGACYSCKKIVRSVIKPSTIKNDKGESKEILRGYCIHCGEVVSSPYQNSIQLSFA